VFEARLRADGSALAEEADDFHRGEATLVQDTAHLFRLPPDPEDGVALTSTPSIRTMNVTGPERWWAG